MPTAPIIMWMMHSHLKDLITKWFQRSQGKRIAFDVFDRFTALWISFNAWGRYVARTDNDREIIEWAKKNPNLNAIFKGLIHNDSSFARDLEELRTMCPIRRNKPYQGSKDVMIGDITNFNEVLETIYAIRCNFFHGEKSLESNRDTILIGLAFAILSKVFTPVIAEL